MQQWTNEATNPSYSRDRGYGATKKILGDIGVAKCAQGTLASQISEQEGYTPAMVSNSGVWTKDYDYQPEMVMSFGMEDSADVVPYVNEPFVAEAYTHKCNGYTHHVAYMPKCQNLAALTTVEPEYPFGFVPPGHSHSHGNGHHSHGNGNGYGHDHDDMPTGNVPVASTVTLLALGVIAMVWFKRR